MQKNNCGIGHENKKKFAAKIFNLLKDFDNEIIWGKGQAHKLENLINSYTKKDKRFVENTIKDYEFKLNQTVENALKAAKENN